MGDDDEYTPEEIRELAIDRLARHDAGAPDAWDRMPPEVHDRLRKHVTPYVDALGDLLPTSTETVIEIPSAGIPEGSKIEMDPTGTYAVDRFGRRHDFTLVLAKAPHKRRYVTEWVPVEGGAHA